MYDSILVPTDGSEAATIATTEAIAFARRFDASLSLLSVVEPPPVPLSGTHPSGSNWEALDDQTREALDRAESRAAAADVPCQRLVERGTPHEVIEERVDDADLVAMGTHGRTGLERLLLGSVTERVLRTCATPVLTTRVSDEPGSIDTVLVPTDGSDCAARATDLAVTLADEFDATVRALGVVDERTLAAGYDTGAGLPNFVDALTDERREAVADVHERAASRGVDCETTVVEGTPERVISEYVDEFDVDLVSMGTHGKTGVDRVFLGSVAERTIRASRVPVLATPAASD